MIDHNSASPFVPRALRGTAPAHRQLDGSLIFADLSGFTALSERLAKQGPVGAELMSAVLNERFGRLLNAAEAMGGDLLHYGGDALLLAFDGEGHEARALSAAATMRQRLRGSAPGVPQVRLRMSTGVASGPIELLTVGGRFPMLLASGPTVSRTLTFEANAQAGQIFCEPSAAAVAAISAKLDRSGDVAQLVSVRRPPQAVGVSVRPPVDQLVLDPYVAAAVQAGAAPEHRVSTICFVKFVGTDSLASRPNELLEAMHQLVSEGQQVADDFEVALLAIDVDVNGGKLMFNAGGLHATGDDDERAILVAQRMVAVDSPLQLRAGVNSGRVFIGSVGPSSTRAFTHIGDAVNLAARVMAKAATGTVLATDTVLERCRTVFSSVPIEPFAAKGKSQLVQASVVGRPVQRRRDDGTFVGRDLDLDEARRQLAAGSNVIIEGQAGSGKSTLMRHITEALTVRQLRAECGRYLQSTPYMISSRLLRSLLGIAADASAADHLAQIVPESMTPLVPLLAAAFGERIDDNPHTARIAPADRRARLNVAIGQLLHSIVDQPTVVVVEDLHWCDDSSLELFHAVFGAVPALQLLATTRPAGDTPFKRPTTRTHTLSLGALDERAAAAVVRERSADNPLAAGDVDGIVERAAGNPLYLLALTDAVSTGTSLNALPESIEPLLQAELDRCSREDRRLLSHAAVVGMRFDPKLVADSLGIEADDVVRRLGPLSQVVAASTEHRFVHALVRDAAYHSLPFRERQLAHGRVFDSLLRADSSAVELLATHAQQAARWATAAHYLRLAAERAESLHADEENLRFTQDTIDASRRIGTPIQELAPLVVRAAALYRRTGRTDAGLRFCMSWRRRLPHGAERIQLDRQRARMTGDIGALTSATRLTRRLRHLTDVAAEQMVELYIDEASTLCSTSKPAAALALLEELDQHGLVPTTRQQPRVALHRAQAMGMLGMDGVIPLLRDTLEQATDRRQEAQILLELGVELYYIGAWEEAARSWRDAVVRYVELGDTMEIAVLRNNLGEVALDQGDLTAAATELHAALDVFRGARRHNATVLTASNLCRLHRRLGDLAESHRFLEMARSSGQASLLLHNGELDAAESELLLAEGRPAEAAALAAAAIRSAADRTTALSVVARLHRLAALAAFAEGRTDDGRASFRASLDVAMRADAPFEFALSTRAWNERDPDADVDATAAAETLTQLGVIAPDLPDVG